MVKNFHKIGKDFYLLKSSEPDFHRNIYFRVFRGDSRNVNMIMDPGTKQDLNDIITVAKELFGGINNLDLIFISHQDPDLTSVLPSLLAIAPKAKIIASIDTWRLVKMYGDLNENRFIAIENFKSDVLTIKSSGHRIRFVPATYCHFRGAMMLYDYENKILFTGDFMGGVDTRKGEGIYANEASWEGIKMFHEIYMPVSLAIKETIDRISTLNPFPEIIAPQHGDVLKDDYVVEFLTRLYDLEVGFDLMRKIEPEKELTIVALNSFYEQIKKTHPDFAEALFKSMSSAGNFTSPFIVKGESLVDLKLPSLDAIHAIWSKIALLADPASENDIKTMFIATLEQYNVPHDLKIEEKVEDIEDLFD